MLMLLTLLMVPVLPYVTFVRTHSAIKWCDASKATYPPSFFFILFNKC